MHHERNELSRAKRFSVTPIKTMLEISSNRHHYISTSQTCTGHPPIHMLGTKQCSCKEREMWEGHPVPLRYSIVSSIHVIRAFRKRLASNSHIGPTNKLIINVTNIPLTASLRGPFLPSSCGSYLLLQCGNPALECQLTPHPLKNQMET
jgi:hypothetical protein